jgi:NAD(P)-dependent dehydrogenase (short-subunit alcohol dehydrogenase family)
MGRRVCVVTGASGGIGRGIVARLRTEGWAVVGFDLSPPAEPDGDDLVSLVGDVAERASHQAALAAARDLGSLTGWVNCAGYNILGSVVDLDEAALRRGVDVDLLGVFHGCAVAVASFLADEPEPRAGSIVNISSVQASVGFPGFAAYAMCKGGIEALTRQVAAEYVGRQIRCNAVAPGLIASPMNDQLLADAVDPEGLRRGWDALTPIGRWGQPADVAAAVAYLLDPDQAGFVTGHVLEVNGGMLALARGR